MHNEMKKRMKKREREKGNLIARKTFFSLAPSKLHWVMKQLWNYSKERTKNESIKEEDK